jgi:hypothetical protein
MKERRERRRRSRGSSWFLLTGFVIGLAMGLVYAYLVSPTEYVDASPSTLNSLDKDRYRVMIAQAYQADGNLERARQRLLLLKDGSGPLSLAALAQRLAAANAGDPDAQALAALAGSLSPAASPSPLPAPSEEPSPLPTQNLTALAVAPSATLAPGEAVRTPTPIPSATPTITRPPTLTRTITLTQRVTFTPRYTDVPTSTLGAPFSLKDKKQVCDPALRQGLLQVEVDNSAGQGIPGVRILVTWGDASQDTFYTGLMPEIGPGYADFVMTSNVTYSIRAGDAGQVAQGLSIPTCSNAGSTFPGGWKVVFGQ